MEYISRGRLTQVLGEIPLSPPEAVEYAAQMWERVQAIPAERAYPADAGLDLPEGPAALMDLVAQGGEEMTRSEILEAARVCVCGERENDYGSPEDSFTLIGHLWAAYKGVPISPKDVAVMMALLKVARIKASDKADSFVDLAGYAACAGEIATKEATLGDG